MATLCRFVHKRHFGLAHVISFLISYAFSIVDVDVPEPDEKSVITYVSSLYDVFPEVPTVEQSLMDNVSSLSLSIKVSHYLRIIPV